MSVHSICQFETILVRNRLSQAMSLLVHPFSLAEDHICTLVMAPKDVHPSLLAKNAEYIVSQLRERFSRKVKNFSVVEIRRGEAGSEAWYGWKFNWIGNTPLESQCYLLSPPKKQYYQKILTGFDQSSNVG